MTEGAIPIGVLSLAGSALLVVVAGLVSLGLRLGMERQLAIASMRTIVQLLLVGYVLSWVFALEELPDGGLRRRATRRELRGRSAHPGGGRRRRARSPGARPTDLRGCASRA